MSTSTMIRKWGAALAAAGVAGLAVGQQPDVVVDQYGTEYLPEALPNLGAVPDYPQDSDAAGPVISRDGGRIYLEPQQSQLSSEVLVDRLDGVVLVPTPGDVIPAGIPGVQGIWHDLEDFPEKAGNALNQYIGGPVSLASLDSMVRDTIQAYRASDRPVVDVLVPEQDITSGVVQLVVVEGRLGGVRVTGATREEESYLRKQIRTKKGDVLRSSDLMADLAWVNRSPYRRVDLVYAPGFEFGTTDLILRTNEIDPFTAYWGYENSGNELLGEHRWVGGMTWAEAWGPDRTLSYQLTTDLEFDTITSHSAVYSMPLPWRQSLTVLGAYVDSNATVDIDGTPLDISGTSWQMSTRWAMPMKAWWENTSHEIELGTDFKSSNNNLEFGGAEFFDATTHIYQASIGYNLLAQGKNGATRLDLTGYISPGGIDDRNNDETFQQARADASAGYVYATLGIEHSHRLPKDLTLRLRSQGQVSGENLLASEQLGIGGPSTVRGYPTSIARGDQGILLSAELYSPTYSLAERLNWRNTNDELRFLIFADYAAVSNVNAAPGEVDDQHLFAVGAGFRWVYDEWFRLRVDVGIPISEQVADEDAVDDIRIHIGATTLW